MDSAAPPVRFRDPQIEMAHGAGGKASRRLVEDLFLPLLLDPTGSAPEPPADAAAIDVDGARLAITTDSFVVTPLRFPGGSIGELAVNGTINDLAVSGARPVALVATLRARGRPPVGRARSGGPRDGPRRPRRRGTDRGR